jgi:hypothetical protein
MPPAHRRLFALALAAGWAAAHVCLLAPAQRSGLPADLGALPGGADACYSSRKCPPRVAGGPVTALAGGQGFDVLLQQNLNHYNHHTTTTTTHTPVVLLAIVEDQVVERAVERRRLLLVQPADGAQQVAGERGAVAPAGEAGARVDGRHGERRGG